MLALFAKAVRLMKAKEPIDPRSWSWQARTHWVESETSKAAAIAAAFANSPLELRLLAEATWQTCRAHAATDDPLLFLPWHRAYLGYFEDIVRSVLADDGEPAADTFALPYWDWLKAGETSLPREFLLEGDPIFGPLFHPVRSPSANAGGSIIDPLDAASPLGFATYGPDRADSGFCQGIDFMPHGVVHGAIGGDMGRVPTAGRDPIFWVHHASIDRVWEIWLGQGGGRQNPTDASWLNASYAFAVRGSSGLPERAEISTSEAALASTFGTSWDSLDLPPEVVLAQSTSSDRLIVGPSTRLDLGTGRSITEVRLPDLRMDELRALTDEPTSGARVFLVLDDLRADGATGGNYDVLLIPPEGEPVRAGQVSFFGAQPIESPQTELLTRFTSFDVTDEISALVDRFGTGLLEAPPMVQLVPQNPDQPGALPVVERVFLAYQ
jgi:tyrosinase